jgi:hypothetical protein
MKIAPVQKQTKAGQRTRFRVSTLALSTLFSSPTSSVEGDDNKPSSLKDLVCASVQAGLCRTLTITTVFLFFNHHVAPCRLHWVGLGSH